jgi:hypothetical protein
MYCRLVFLGEEKNMNLGANFLYNFYFQEIMEFWVKKSDSYSLEAKLDLDKGLNIETASKKNTRLANKL